MSVGTSTSTIACTRSTRKMVVTGGPIWFRQLVTLTVTGYTPSSASNLIFLLYRGATLVAYCDAFTGGANSATGNLDTNTTELETAMGSIRNGVEKEFDAYVYDTDGTSLECIASGEVKIRQTRDYSETSPVSPISATTVFFGNMAVYQGNVYVKNETTGKYHRLAVASVDGVATDVVDNTGIDIPGAP